MGANNRMDSGYVDLAEERIAESRVVMTVLEIPVSAAARAMELGKKHGAMTILNPAPAAALPESIFQYVDYLTPNESELRILLGLPPNDPASTDALASRLRALGVRNVIVTMGKSGALILNDDGSLLIPSVSVDVVDTTGAGDAFNAGLAFALAQGRPLREAVQFACCAGALACTKLGVIPALARQAAVERLYQTYFALA
jgi:ribokinase